MTKPAFGACTSNGLKNVNPIEIAQAVIANANDVIVMDRNWFVWDKRLVIEQRSIRAFQVHDGELTACLTQFEVSGRDKTIGNGKPCLCTAARSGDLF